MKSVAIVNLSDTGLRFDRSGIDLNECRAVERMLKAGGVQCKLLDCEHQKEAQNYDVLFVKTGAVDNWGGEQSKHVKNTINEINAFDGPVLMLTVDQDFKLPNKQRKDFVTIDRPVYLLCVGGNMKMIAEKNFPDVNIAGTIQFNHCVEIGRELSKTPFINTKPIYDAVYGGAPRKELLNILGKISEKHSLLTFFGKNNALHKKLSKTIDAGTKFWLDNLEMRSLNSLGKHSFIFYKPRTPWLTPRIFEQLDSNSMVLFDTKWKQTEPFWTETNTFSNDEELLELMKHEPTETDIKAQHDLSLAFDYDGYNEEQMAHIMEFLE